MIDQNDLRDAIDNSATEVFLVHGEDQIVISQSIGEGPNGEPYAILAPDGKHYAMSVEAILDTTIDGHSIRSMLNEMEW